MELRPDVVAGKYDASIFDKTGFFLLVNEIFYSIQGEGAHAGEACVFIRLAKCNLACKFCDTEFETFRSMNIEEIVHKVSALVPPGENTVQVTLTGGEPMLQNCGPLLAELKSLGHYTTIETSGSVWSAWASGLDWITISPKVRLRDIPEQLKIAASEYKWIVNEAFLRIIEKSPKQCWMPLPAKNYLQPEWGTGRERYTAAAIKLVLAHPTRYSLSLQQHKLAGVP